MPGGSGHDELTRGLELLVGILLFGGHRLPGGERERNLCVLIVRLLSNHLRRDQADRYRRRTIAQNRLSCRICPAAGEVDNRCIDPRRKRSCRAIWVQKELHEANDRHSARRCRAGCRCAVIYRHSDQRITDHHILCRQAGNRVVAASDELKRCDRRSS